MITVEDAAKYLAELGLAIPTVILECLVDKANSIEPCMTGAGYDECTQKLISFYLVGMLATSSGARRIKSQGAPSGASRSFEYSSLADLYRQLQASLAVLDPSGCSNALQPAAPGPQAALFIASGGCCL